MSEICIDPSGPKTGDGMDEVMYDDDDPAPLLASKGARPIAEAPHDGRVLRLLVDYGVNQANGEHPMKDVARYAWTIGHNNGDDTGEDQWQFAGWDWSHDCFTEGVGTPVGWLPFFDTAPAKSDRP